MKSAVPTSITNPKGGKPWGREHQLLVSDYVFEAQTLAADVRKQLREAYARLIQLEAQLTSAQKLIFGCT